VTDEPDSPDFERLLHYLRETRGFDFSGYKRTTLLRRIAKRMTHVGVDGHGAYLDYLQANPDEFGSLFNTILINVTSYFRDAAAWEYLQAEILPRIIEAKAPYEPIRVWSAGVASGEERTALPCSSARCSAPQNTATGRRFTRRTSMKTP
jgi:two-component system, chemotaxis family, CheB/CheR fusion protein